jgi:hypothetical protein
MDQPGYCSVDKGILRSLAADVENAARLRLTCEGGPVPGPNRRGAEVHVDHEFRARRLHAVHELARKVLEANAAFMKAFTDKLRAAGELAGAEGLASPVQAKRVRADKDGAPITDGVFPESKEFLAGYWIVDVDSPERAYELAAEASTAPGVTIKAADGTVIDHLWIEVREVMSSHKDLK